MDKSASNPNLDELLEIQAVNMSSMVSRCCAGELKKIMYCRIIC